MNVYDQHYRRLFSNPAMVQALFNGILPDQLRQHLDLSSLTPLPSSFVSSRARDRHSDIIWQVKRTDGAMLYLVILLEHQSRPDRFMSVRMMGYCALLYEDIIKRRTKGKPATLPAILPIVLYTGTRRWHAPLMVSELLDNPPEELQIYQPQMRYLLLDARALVERDNLPANNLAALLFQLEHNQGLEQVREILQTLVQLTQDPAYQEVSHAFGLWINHVLLPRSLPDSQDLPTSPTLQEVTTMLASQSRDWSYRWKQEGRVEGRLEGRQEGRQEAMTTILGNLLQRKFGQLSPEILAKLHTANAEQLQAWSLNILDAQTPEDVFRG